MEKTVSPHLDLALGRVNRSLSFCDRLIQLGAVFTLIAAGALIVSPKAVALIVLALLGLQCLMLAWEQKLKNQLLVLFRCANAIARNDGEAFERALKPRATS